MSQSNKFHSSNESIAPNGWLAGWMRPGYLNFAGKRQDRIDSPVDKQNNDETGMQDESKFGNIDFRYIL
jgi:hypothetical protein